jgi:hypothetical protein
LIVDGEPFIRTLLRRIREVAEAALVIDIPMPEPLE